MRFITKFYEILFLYKKGRVKIVAVDLKHAYHKICR